MNRTGTFLIIYVPEAMSKTSSCESVAATIALKIFYK